MPLSSQGYENHFADRAAQERSEMRNCTDPAHVDGCPCGHGGDPEFRPIQIASIGTVDKRGVRHYLGLPDPADGIAICLRDGRLISIGDFGKGPVIQVEGPDAETLAEWPLPVPGRAPLGGIEQYQAEDR